MGLSYIWDCNDSDCVIITPSFSLIDDSICNDVGGAVDSTSDLLINDISDHKMIFTHLPNDLYKNKVSKFIVMQKNNEASTSNNFTMNLDL